MTQDYPITRRSALKRGALLTGAMTVGSVGATGTAAAGIGEGRVLDLHLNNARRKRIRGKLDSILFHDASPERNDGVWSTATGDPITRDGKVGNSLELPGGEYIRVRDDPSLQFDGAFSAAAWVKFAGSSASPNDYEFFLSKRRADDGEYQVYYAKNQGLIKYWNGSKIHRIDLDLAPDTWHHLAWIFDGSEFMAYHDGNEVGRTTASAPSSSNNDLYVGQDNVGNFAKAKNDEVRLYDRVLSADEIGDLAAMGDD